MADLPTYLIEAADDDPQLQHLRATGIRYWNQLKDVSSGSKIEIEAIKNIHIRIEEAFDRPLLVSRPPYRGVDGAEGFAYARYLIEHYQNRHTNDWKLIEQHLGRITKDAQDIANRQKQFELRKARASGPRNKLIKTAAENAMKNHPNKLSKWYFPQILRAELDTLGAQPEVNQEGTTISYTEVSGNKSAKKSITLSGFLKLISSIKKKTQ